MREQIPGGVCLKDVCGEKMLICRAVKEEHQNGVLARTKSNQNRSSPKGEGSSPKETTKVTLVADSSDPAIGYYRKGEMEEVKRRSHETDLMSVQS
ncbi:hypothetical protein Bca52824_075661 [Brassica carinata]|uniref:Uncharacterized protein n=1 Tax=Brassica carinata TaxID=52824 RepID=A0A8X7TVX8_BRACI|nr:hypothetical protein Bca52824_075661 [Brassica carinata]